MGIVISKVASIFLLILVGYIAYRLNILGDSSIPTLTKLVMQVLGPCMTMSAIYSRELTHELIHLTVQVILGAAIYYAVATLLCYFLVQVFRFRPRDEWGVYIASIIPSNTGFMGFPVTRSIFGTEMLYLMAMINVVMNIYNMVFLPFIFNIGKSWRPTRKELFLTVANPIVISVIIGLIMLIAGLYPPKVLDEIINMLGDATVPLSMILVGVQLGSRDLKKVINANNLKSMFIGMLLLPTLIFAALYPMGFLAVNAKVALIFATVFPTAVITVALAEQYHKNAKLLSEIVSLTTLVSIATIPAAATILTMVFL